MKMNFMYILATLGFGGVFPIYWIIERKHAIIFTYRKYACKGLSRTKRRCNLEETSRRST